MVGWRTASPACYDFSDAADNEGAHKDVYHLVVNKLDDKTSENQPQNAKYKVVFLQNKH